MGWLVGLPLGIFRILAGLFLLVFRFAVPLGVLILLVVLWRKHSRMRREWNAPPREPEFDGPVYNVDYKIVEEDEKEGS